MPARLTVASPSNAATRKFRFDLPNCVCAAGQEHTPLKLVVVACRMPSRVGNNINTELFLDGGPASWSPIKLYLLGGDQSRGTERFRLRSTLYPRTISCGFGDFGAWRPRGSDAAVFLLPPRCSWDLPSRIGRRDICRTQHLMPDLRPQDEKFSKQRANEIDCDRTNHTAKKTDNQCEYNQCE